MAILSLKQKNYRVFLQSDSKTIHSNCIININKTKYKHVMLHSFYSLTFMKMSRQLTDNALATTAVLIH